MGRMQRSLPIGLLYVVAIVIATLFLIPIAWMVITAFEPPSEIYSAQFHILPQKPTLSNFIDVARSLPQFPLYLRNSLIVTAISVAAVTLLSTLAAYPLGRMRFPGMHIVLGAILLVLAIPYALYLIPVYLLELNWGLLNTVQGLILPYIALNAPLAIVLMRGTYRSVPREIEEAARVDGASALRTWRSIMLPLAGPGVASVVIFTFIAVWGEFMFAVTLFSSGGNTTFPVGITFLKEQGSNYSFGLLGATIVIAIIPTLIIFLFLQRFFIRGLLEGAVK